MRKFNYVALLAAALSIFASCKKEFVSTENEEGEALYSFTASLEDVTKTNLVDGTKVAWSDGDEISVNGRTFVATVDAENPTHAMFNLKAGQTAPTGTTFRAFYPSSTYSSTSGRITLPASYTYNASNLLSVSPMYATFTGAVGEASFNFKNVCALLAVDVVGNNKVKSVALTANAAIRGNLPSVAIDATTGALTYGNITSTQAAYKTVTINAPTAGVQLDPETPTRFYVPVPERSAAYTSFVVTVTDTDGNVKTLKSTASSITVAKNNIYHLPVIDATPVVLELDADITIASKETTSPTTAVLKLNVDADADVTYVLAVESVGYVSQYPDELTLAKEDIAYWKSQGATALSQLLNAGIAYKGSQENIVFDYVVPGSDYIAYAYAIDADFNVSPAILTETIHIDEYVFPEAGASYEDYLGQWQMGTEVITITENVTGESYFISGIKNQINATYNYNVEHVNATFEDGYIVLKEQATDATCSVGSYGTCSIYLSGVFSQSGSTYGYYPINGTEPQEIFRGTLSDGKINVIAGACKYGAFESMGFSWVIQSGTNKGKGNTFAGSTLMDMVAIAEIPNDVYGNWICPSATDGFDEPSTYTNWTMTISEGAGMTLKVAGFDAGIDAICEKNSLEKPIVDALYDVKSQTFNVAQQYPTGLVTGQTESDVIYWFALEEDLYNVSTNGVSFKFDFVNNTLSLNVPGYIAMNGNSEHSFFTAPLVFYKEGHVPANAPVLAPAKAAARTYGKSSVMNLRTAAPRSKADSNCQIATFCPKETRSSSRLLK